MVIDFSKLDLKERPHFILQNLDETNIGYLGAILSPTAKLCYNEVSEISFEYPNQIDGVELSEYELLTSMRVIDVQGYGRFLLKDQKEKDNGIVKKKQCTAYSLEIELGNKTITLPEGLYKLYDPMSSGDSDKIIMDIILSKFPSWSIGEVDQELWDSYRYFSVDGVTGYNLMKSDLQEKYSCIFDFDTYNRSINIRSVNSAVATKPVYLSKRNLLKEIDIDEDTENLVTALDVYGADGVDIRNVNPLGTDTIYNLDYFMTEEFFSSDIIEKWGQWKSNLESKEDEFFLLTMQRLGSIGERTTAEAELTDLNGELSSLESQMAVIIQAINSTDPSLEVPIPGTNPVQNRSAIEQLEDDLQEIKRKIADKESEIHSKKNQIDSINEAIGDWTSDLQDIVDNVSMDNYFTAEELEILDRYFKGGTLTDETFVLSDVQSYGSMDETASSVFVNFIIENNKGFEHTEYASSMDFWNIRGGKVRVEYYESLESEEPFGTISSDIVRGTFEKDSTSNKCVLSLYVANGEINGVEYDSATLTIVGTFSGSLIGQDIINCSNRDATVTLSLANSFYQKYAVQQELYEYGKSNLVKLSSPTYTFSVNSANFFALREFELFAKNFELGEKIYLHLDDRVLEPIVVSADIDFDDLSKLQLSFSDSFQSNDATFKLESLLDKSVSMGSALSVNQYKYSDFVTSGADNTVENFITSAIDAMKNNILSGNNNEVTIDGAGIRLRKWENGAYSDKQVWINNNALMFTDNGWGDADGSNIGIGEFYDKNFGTMYGVVAPAVVGTLLAGNQLIIESTKTDGNVLAFRVDSSGASLHNGTFTLYDAAQGTGGRIGIDPLLGIYGGNNINMLHYNSSTGLVDGMMTTEGDYVTFIDDLTGTDEPKSNFWVDMNGEVYLKGTIYAEAGEFKGSLKIGGDTGFRVDEQGNLSIGGTASNPNFYISADGNMRANSGTFKGTIEGATLKGSLEADTDTGGWLTGTGIRVGGDVNPPTENPSDYNFFVDGDGNITAKGNVNLANGNVTLGSGAISWNNLASDAQSEVTDAQSDAASALSAASTASSNIKKLANGTYSGGTFISGTSIESPNITGGVVAGGEFTNLDKGTYLEIGDPESHGFGDLYLRGRNTSTHNDWEIFRVQDNLGGASIFIYGAEILAGQNNGTDDDPEPYTTLAGTWDFSEARVLGVDSTAVFG